MKKLGVAIIGCGSISDIYMQNIKSGKFQILELIGCANRHHEAAVAKAALYGCKAMTTQEICADPNVDMVINLTTPASHYEVTKQCLEAGKHVFSEKMLAVDLWQGKELVDLANQKGLYLGVAPDTFLGASVQTAKYIVEKGLIGKPVSCHAAVSRNYGIYGEFLTHLCKPGGGIGFDMGGYYLTALAAILGPVKSVSAFTAIHDPHRVNTRIGAPEYGKAYDMEEANVITATLQYESGVLGTLHMNSDCILDETYSLVIYGTEGILYMGNPNEFGNPVYLQKTLSGKTEFPHTHGYGENSRGVGAAEMAWAITGDRKNRASKEMAYHVFELMHSIMTSAETGKVVELASTFQTPDPLPAGYMGDGGWTRKEESALI